MICLSFFLFLPFLLSKYSFYIFPSSFCISFSFFHFSHFLQVFLTFYFSFFYFLSFFISFFCCSPSLTVPIQFLSVQLATAFVLMEKIRMGIQAFKMIISAKLNFPKTDNFFRLQTHSQHSRKNIYFLHYISRFTVTND